MRAAKGDCEKVKDACPISCKRCTHCVGVCPGSGTQRRQPRTKLQKQLRRKLMMHFQEGSTMNVANSFCASYPRCAMFGCCDFYPYCFKASMQALGNPPQPFVSGGAGGHARTQQRQTRQTLSEGLAALPFTTPQQFLDLAWRPRSSFRVLYLIQGSRLAKLPPECNMLARSRPSDVDDHLPAPSVSPAFRKTACRSSPLACLDRCGTQGGWPRFHIWLI